MAVDQVVFNFCTLRLSSMPYLSDTSYSANEHLICVVNYGSTKNIHNLNIFSRSEFI